MDHGEVAQKIIDSEKEVMGQVAVMKASGLDFVDDEGQVSEDIGKSQVEELMDTYKQLQGQGALGIAKRGFEEGELEEADIDVPEELLD